MRRRQRNSAEESV